ncbi:putative glycosyltransferase [Gordonia paraffinivorans NBRC 108238]|uniref:Glycosyltransferase n=1 Tax=Gordonia paraffinivorans NBRC 108238 TaxID=1223543 RepID=A0ABQ0IQ61_9ACTN|nr:glycosyltransferase family 2 protein [Gordonia paraffinivorans]GAC85706.1 putative glycosyltransferase [Gordonia paraffinivorans NBRC 108238]
MRLSLVVPVYNEVDTITACLEHIARQVRPFDEVIIVDNNCTDGTMDVVRTFADRIPLRILVEPVPGVAAARRTGFNAAVGDIIGRIDADTRLDPQWAGRAVRFFNSDPDADAVYGGVYFYDTPLDSALRKLVRKEAGQALRSGSVAGDTLQGSNMAIRREMWRSAEPLLLDQPGTHEDLDLYCAVVKSGGVVRRYAALTVAQSARRLAEPVRANIAYARAAIRTHELHGDEPGARRLRRAFPMNVVLLGISRMLLVPFDPETRQWRPFRDRRQGRISPIEGSRSG